MTTEDERRAEALRLLALWKGREWSWTSRFRDTQSELERALRDGSEKEVVFWLEQIEALYNEPQAVDTYEMRQKAVNDLVEAVRQLSRATGSSYQTILHDLRADAQLMLEG